MKKLDLYPAIIDVLYSFDRIRFLSKYSVKDVKIIIPESELLKHCLPDNNSIVKVHIDQTGREWGWKTKVEASACNDTFFEVIKGYNFGILSHLQIARDVIFPTMDEANIFMEWFEKNIDRRYSRKRFKYEATLYLGTLKGQKSDNYVRCYVRESKLTGAPCFHSEFTLEGATAIKKALCIKSYNDLMTSMECYYMLENKYLHIKDSGLKQGLKFGSSYLQQKDYERIKKRILLARGITGNSL